MIEQDTIRLLRECDAGIKMGISAIDEVEPYADSSDFRRQLIKCRDRHAELDKDLRQMLNRYHDDGKEPDAMAKGMSWVKTSYKLAVNKSDSTIADLMTDGCNMGVKSLRKYLNQYKAADEQSKDIAKRLINIEQKLTHDIADYL